MYDADYTAEVQRRFAILQGELAEELHRCGRNPGEVIAVGVTKTHPPTIWDIARQAEIHHVGENYAQEVRDKIAWWNETMLPTPPPQLHIIGNLQRNKVKYVVPSAALIHTVDSAEIAQEIHDRSLRRDVVTPVLVQVNTSAEEQKHGVTPEAVSALVDSLLSMQNIQLQGFMTIAAFLDDVEQVRPMFALLREIREKEQHRIGNAARLQHLSMGMSHDWRAAVREGATIIRVGTALFGARG